MPTKVPLQPEDHHYTIHLHQATCLEDLDYRQLRRLDKSLMITLEMCQWIQELCSMYHTTIVPLAYGCICQFRSVTVPGEPVLCLVTPLMSQI
jgi:hypothetical protein